VAFSFSFETRRGDLTERSVCGVDRQGQQAGEYQRRAASASAENAARFECVGDKPRLGRAGALVRVRICDLAEIVERPHVVNTRDRRRWVTGTPTWRNCYSSRQFGGSCG
jgi:hypothetical protein